MLLSWTYAADAMDVGSGVLQGIAGPELLPFMDHDELVFYPRAIFQAFSLVPRTSQLFPDATWETRSRRSVPNSFLYPRLKVAEDVPTEDTPYSLANLGMLGMPTSLLLCLRSLLPHSACSAMWCFLLIVHLI